MPLTSFATAGSEKHRERRAAIASFFNRSRIRDYSHYIQTMVDRISHRLSSEYAGTEKVLNLLDMWGSMASDVIMEFCFARPKDHIDAPEFKSRGYNDGRVSNLSAGLTDRALYVTSTHLRYPFSEEGFRARGGVGLSAPDLVVVLVVFGDFDTAGTH
ncbi:hypothetical protein F5Y06DRAFT_292575 [Hypoxylon sp. FL0890]|nr:hypothetical protein F5Y06DRAFT_292575 [Hypoxylon sp. FL0890]